MIMDIGRVCIVLLLSLVLTLDNVLAEDGIPDFSDEVQEEDLADEFTLQLRYDNDDKPDRCRTDICVEDVTVDDGRRGTFHWRRVEAGVRLHVRCPYSVDGLYYVMVTHATRDCQLNGTVANWSTPHLEECPKPPFTELVDHFTSLFGDENIQDKPFSARMSWFADMTSVVSENIKRYPQNLILNDDMVKYETLLITMAEIFTVGSVRIDKGTIQLFIDNLEFMSRNSLWTKYSPFKKSIPRYLAALCHKVKSGVVVSSLNIHLAAHLLPATAPPHTTVLPYALGEAILTVQPDPKESATLYLVAVDLSAVSRGQQGAYRPTIFHQPSFTPYGMMEPLVYVALVKSSGVWVRPQVSYPARPTDGASDPVLPESEDLPNQTCEALNVTSLLQLSTLSIDKMGAWENSDCKPSYRDDSNIQCTCQGSGFFAIFEKDRSGLVSVRKTGEEVEDTPPRKEISTLEVFLGFPFHWPLYVLGHVLRAVSLLCLTLTLVSYLVLHKARLGVPTRILLHLCFTLVLLSIVLYIAEATAFTRIGCRVSNALRYYLIMTSLLWNGIEAVNMYLMLVQVIGSNTRRFVRKAALVAYGVPAIAVGVVLAASLRAFDGMYDLQCDFVCRLSNNILYFGYLLPLGLIMTNNIIVFILVCRVLLKQHQSTDSKHQAHSRSRPWLRLSAAVSLLVLLGVPWLFSAFGAIDNSHSKVKLASLQGAIQIIFIIFINLQGVFIFCFHCARRAEIRKSWLSLASSTRRTSVTNLSSLRSRRSSLLSGERTSKRYSRSMSTDELKVALNTVSSSRPTSSLASEETKPLNFQKKSSI